MTELTPDVMPKLTPEQLKVAQLETLESARRHYGPAARVLFKSMDVFYGGKRTYSKFKVLELIARVPYQAWENVAYVASTHRASRPNFVRRIFDRVREARGQQDNELWHLLILEELVSDYGRRESFFRYRVLPQVIAFVYYWLSWILYVMNPRWSYRLNADFEDHAEHEYALFVQENRDLEQHPYDGLFVKEYGRFQTLSDLFRQISHDERVHKDESLARMQEARFR